VHSFSWGFGCLVALNFESEIGTPVTPALRNVNASFSLSLCFKVQAHVAQTGGLATNAMLSVGDICILNLHNFLFQGPCSRDFPKNFLCLRQRSSWRPLFPECLFVHSCVRLWVFSMIFWVFFDGTKLLPLSDFRARMNVSNFWVKRSRSQWGLICPKMHFLAF